MTKNLKKLAQKYFILGDFENAKKIYSELGSMLELAYCEIYTGNIKSAKKIISNLPKDSPASEWIIAFVQMLEANLQVYPSFMQIRNFFEIDLDNLFLSGTKEQIENVINYIPFLANINSEIYKLAARVLKNHNQDELAGQFLKKSLEICFRDSETHFLLAELYLKENDKKTATRHLNYACENGSYYPAEKLLKSLT